MNVEKEIADLKRRVAELEGSFGYTSGQLREVQLFLHNNVDTRLTSLEGKVENGFSRMDTGAEGSNRRLVPRGQDGHLGQHGRDQGAVSDGEPGDGEAGGVQQQG